MDNGGQSPAHTADYSECEHSSGRLQTAAIVVEEHHADDLDAVAALFELRQNHLAELVAGGMPAGAEDVRNLHDGLSFLGYWLTGRMLALPYASLQTLL